ncbi:MAG: methylmalonyl Co-A mutase-associated GTPase MeaB, partial [Mycobacterium sp.]|nr:methylmalonyl Co-A mutase-associated GTPase MeaB [Mycobacterium sp.]
TRGRSVGVLAVDPSSARSGGALLGDRARMLRHSGDTGIYIRSLATRGHLGGLVRAAQRLVDALRAARFDSIVLETVGTGQSEIQLAEVATTSVVVCAPGMGDELQALKAGILEIADIVVVNKADQLDPAATQRALREALGAQVPVLVSVAISGAGIVELADAIDRHGNDAHTDVDPRERLRARLEAQVLELARARFTALDAAMLDTLLDAIERNRTTPQAV